MVEPGQIIRRYAITEDGAPVRCDLHPSSRDRDGLKVAYPTKETARHAAWELYVHLDAPQRAHRCRSGQHYHLTSCSLRSFTTSYGLSWYLLAVVEVLARDPAASVPRAVIAGQIIDRSTTNRIRKSRRRISKALLALEVRGVITYDDACVTVIDRSALDRWYLALVTRGTEIKSGAAS